ncbi:hypothetical protein MNBD_IGNAVI01-943, partial [hydrothermal vent metagenome]
MYIEDGNKYLTLTFSKKTIAP